MMSKNLGDSLNVVRNQKCLDISESNLRIKWGDSWISFLYEYEDHRSLS